MSTNECENRAFAAKEIELNQKDHDSQSSSHSKSSSVPRDCNKVVLSVASPVGGEALTFYWPLRESAGYSEGQEILDVVKNVLSSFPELNFIVRQHCGLNIDAIDKRDYDQMSALLEAFNKTVPAITQLWKGATKPGGEIWSEERADPVLLKQICARSYNRAVDNVQHLNNHYKAFSSETYGETSYERLRMIIQEIIPRERDVFVDLGSGVGQLVIQMSGGSRVKKAVGIEIAALPNKYAENLVLEFRKWMKWYGKKFRPLEIFNGDFLDMKFRELITKEATIIFINNYAFTAELETQIKRELLFDLKDGTRIISTKPYGHCNRTITDRHMNDISAILDIYEMSQCENACSWTGNYVPYYHHTVNRSKLEKYFLHQRNPSLKLTNGSDDSRRSSTSSRTSRDGGRWNSRESSASLNAVSFANRGGRAITNACDNITGKQGSKQTSKAQSKSIHSDYDDDNCVYGPTTRKKWQEYCSSRAVRGGDSAIRATVNQNCPIETVNESVSCKKKVRKSVSKGRPRRLSTSKIEAVETINPVSEIRCQSDITPSSLVSDCSKGATSIPSNSKIEMVSKDENKDPVVYIRGSRYPDLNNLLVNFRDMYERQLELLNSASSIPEIEADIQNQLKLKSLLISRTESLQKQIASLLQTGTQNLNTRLEELGIEAKTPLAFLDGAREIVNHHKELSAECAALEKEVTNLELKQKHQLEMTYPFIDDSSLPIINATRGFVRGVTGPDNHQPTVFHSKKMNSNGLTVVKQSSESIGPVNSGKRSRCRPTRGGQQGKRVTLSTNKAQNDPKEVEDIERRIQDIVAEALKVDCAAKCAEKERRARGERRKEKLSTDLVSNEKIPEHRTDVTEHQMAVRLESSTMRVVDSSHNLTTGVIETDVAGSSMVEVRIMDVDSIRSDDE